MVNPVTSLLSLLQPSQDFYIITIHPSVSQLSDFGTVSSPFLCPSMGPENFSFPLSVFSWERAIFALLGDEASGLKLH